VCNDDERLRAILPRLARRAITYGVREDSDFRIRSFETDSHPVTAPQSSGPPCVSRFSVDYRGKSLGEFQLQVPGAHNVLNATAAIAVAIGLDIAPERIREALNSFRGVDRRFQLRGSASGISVIDDYGHHPTEIRATLAAARQCGFKQVHVVFQPHRYTRTRDLLDQFGTAFTDADSVHVLDIYPASEQPIPGITGELVAQTITRLGAKPAQYVGSFEDAARQVCLRAQEGDMILTLGAGNVSQLGQQILEKLRAKAKAQQVPA
jgi:UDP-N-acetylmuramate--alanine ligase